MTSIGRIGTTIRLAKKRGPSPASWNYFPKRMGYKILGPIPFSVATKRLKQCIFPNDWP